MTVREGLEKKEGKERKKWREGEVEKEEEAVESLRGEGISTNAIKARAIIFRIINIGM